MYGGELRIVGFRHRDVDAFGMQTWVLGVHAFPQQRYPPGHLHAVRALIAFQRTL